MPAQYFRKFIVSIILTVIGLTIPCISLASDMVTIRSETLFRFLERDTAKENDALIVPAYEYLQFDIVNGPVTIHANGWGRADITDNDFFSDQTAGELLYGYLEYRPEGISVFSRLGRQAIYAGVANESIDGIWLGTTYPAKVTFSVYAGQPVSLDSTNGRDGDSIYGGRTSLNTAKLSVGASYKMIENDSIESEEIAGIDYGIMLNNLFISGLSSYNLITEDFGEHSFDAAYTAETMHFRIFYQLFTFEDYFGTGANNANPFRILALTSEELSSYGAEITRGNPESTEIGIKLTRNDYDQEEASHYAALLANRAGESSRYGGELGLSEGENGRNDMIIARGYFSTELGDSRVLNSLSFDILYAIYDQSIFGEDTSFFGAVAGNRKLSDNMTLKLSADYESNPYYDSDFRALVSLIYNISAN